MGCRGGDSPVADDIVALFTILRDTDLDTIEAKVLAIIAECRAGEHQAPKRWEIV